MLSIIILKKKENWNQQVRPLKNYKPGKMQSMNLLLKDLGVVFFHIIIPQVK